MTKMHETSKEVRKNKSPNVAPEKIPDFEVKADKMNKNGDVDISLQEEMVIPFFVQK